MISYDTLAPDSGGWSRVDKHWIETTDDLYIDDITIQVRKEGLFKVTVDGFPRQGNRYLRTKILEGFPQAAIPFPLCHKQVSFHEAIQDNHFVFSTFRDPLESLSSYISEFIKQEHPNGILNPLFKFLYTQDDYIYVEKCFLFYIRMTQFIIDNIKDIYVVPFQSIADDTNNSLSIAISKVLPIAQCTDPVKALPHSSKDLKLKEYLMTDKFKAITEQAYSVYNHVLELSKTHPDRFI